MTNRRRSRLAAPPPPAPPTEADSREALRRALTAKAAADAALRAVRTVQQRAAEHEKTCRERLEAFDTLDDELRQSLVAELRSGAHDDERAGALKARLEAEAAHITADSALAELNSELATAQAAADDAAAAAKTGQLRAPEFDVTRR